MFHLNYQNQINNNTISQDLDINQEDNMFLQHKHTWTFTCKPYKQEHYEIKESEYNFQQPESFDNGDEVDSLDLRSNPSEVEDDEENYVDESKFMLELLKNIIASYEKMIIYIHNHVVETRKNTLEANTSKTSAEEAELKTLEDDIAEYNTNQTTFDTQTKTYNSQQDLMKQLTGETPLPKDKTQAQVLEEAMVAGTVNQEQKSALDFFMVQNKILQNQSFSIYKLLLLLRVWILCIKKPRLKRGIFFEKFSRNLPTFYSCFYEKTSVCFSFLRTLEATSIETTTSYPLPRHQSLTKSFYVARVPLPILRRALSWVMFSDSGI